MRYILAGEEAGSEELAEPGRGRSLYLIGVSAILLAAGLILGDWLRATPYSWAEYAVLLTAYLLVGGGVVSRALRGLVRGQLFDESFLMTVATFGAIAIHELPEAVAVMLFYTVGEYLQERAVSRSRRFIARLLDIRPDYANLKADGSLQKVTPSEVKVGQVIVVKPGERVPLDGEVVDGQSFVDASALTGESVPRSVGPGKEVLAGMINGQGLLAVRVTKNYANSSVARILDLVERAAARKAPTEQFITAFSRYYTPAVVAFALGVVVIPTLFIPGAAFSEWIYRALVLLVISCPCALVVSVPLGYFGGIGGASRQGILVKGANYLEALARVHTVVFDKTGTLTRGVFQVSEVAPRNGFSDRELLRLAAFAEAHSNHPIAKSIKDAYRAIGGTMATGEGVTDNQEIPGCGIRARIDGKMVVAGNDRLMHREGIPHDSCDIEGTAVYVAIDGVFAGYIIISDEVRPDAHRAITMLRRLGVKRIAMLTGDDESAARITASRLGMDSYFSELLPEDKVNRLEELQSSMPARRNWKLVFVGDGVNDAPVITRADVGVAMGGLGSDAAIEAADVVIMEDAPSLLATAIEVARRTGRIVRQNVILALGVKTFFFGLGALGLATVWGAVFADVGVTIIAIFNATRTMWARGDKDR